MWTQDSALMLLLACCLWSAEAQRARRKKKLWDNSIKFKNQANDSCSMVITNLQGNTLLRLSCRSLMRSYWCDYVGLPDTCGPYNKNPRHYFIQMMWDFKEFYNPCLAPRLIKPHMCKEATDTSQMVFSGASFSRSALEASGRRLSTKLRFLNRRRGSAMLTSRVPPQMQPTPRASPPPATAPVESNAKRMAQHYCWRSLQGICSFVIGLVRH